MFLGDSESVYVTASDFPGCQTNSVCICQRQCIDGLNSLDGKPKFYGIEKLRTVVTRLYTHPQPPLLWISPKSV